MKLAPIIIFTYNRPDHTRKTIEALQKNELAMLSDLFLFSDGFKNETDKIQVYKVREYLAQVNNFKSVTIIERERNFGLANNIIDGVKQIIDSYGKVIVLEDDLITSPFFLKYMNEALDLYEPAANIVSIHGYVYPVKAKLPSTFFLIDPGSLGWGTWKDRWDQYDANGARLFEELKKRKLTNKFNYDGAYPFTKMLKNQIEGKNNSWVIRWYAYALLNNKLTLYPGKSLVFHNGSDGSGTHEGASNVLDVELSREPVPVIEQQTVINQEAREAFKIFFRSIRGSLVRRAFRKTGKIIKKLAGRLRS